MNAMGNGSMAMVRLLLNSNFYWGGVRQAVKLSYIPRTIYEGQIANAVSGFHPQKCSSTWFDSCSATGWRIPCSAWALSHRARRCASSLCCTKKCGKRTHPPHHTIARPDAPQRGPTQTEEYRPIQFIYLSIYIYIIQSRLRSPLHSRSFRAINRYVNPS